MGDAKESAEGEAIGASRPSLVRTCFALRVTDLGRS